MSEIGKGKTAAGTGTGKSDATGRRSERDESSKEVLSGFNVSIAIDSTSNVPLHRQLFDALRLAIVELRLMPGQLLPSTRELADHLAVSRTTVVRSYEDLLGQGYVRAVDGVGTFVNPLSSERRATSARLAPNSSPIKLSAYANRLMQIEPSVLTSADQPALHYGASPPAQLPTKQWRQILLRHCREHDPSRFDYDAEPFGHLPLRQAIAGYLSRFRALQCDAEQVAVFAGTLDAPNLVAQLLVDQGDLVLVENPGFTFMRQRFASLGANVQGIEVDQDGLVVEDLNRFPEGARLLYITPSHQDPTGAVLSLPRRKEVLDWAAHTGTLIVEDDYDAEYRYSGSQLPSLQGLDDNDCVIYLCSFWKTLFPIVSGGYLVLPHSFAAVFSHAIYMREGAVNTSFPMLEQLALTEFINEGCLERHIRKTHPIYARRWQALVSALTVHLRGRLTMAKESAAMHLLVRFDVSLTDEEVIGLASRASLAMTSTRGYYLKSPRRGEFLIPFAHVDEADLQRSIEYFARLLNEQLNQN